MCCVVCVVRVCLFVVPVLCVSSLLCAGVYKFASNIRGLLSRRAVGVWGLQRSLCELATHCDGAVCGTACDSLYFCVRQVPSSAQALVDRWNVALNPGGCRRLACCMRRAILFTLCAPFLKFAC